MKSGRIVGPGSPNSAGPPAWSWRSSPREVAAKKIRRFERCSVAWFIGNSPWRARSRRVCAREDSRATGGISTRTCDRLNGTPFVPFYLTVVGIAEWVFLIVFPMAIADAAGYWAILYTFLLGMILNGLVHSAYSLMDPFVRQPSAVALEAITRGTEIDLLQQLGEKEVPSPVAPVDRVYLP